MKINDNISDFISENFKREDLDNIHFLYNLRRVFSRELGVENQVAEVNVSKLNGSPFSFVTATYDPNQKTILFDLNAIRKKLNYLRNSKIFNSDYKECHQFLFYQIIFHEFLHAYQEELIYHLTDKSFSTRIIRDSKSVIYGDYKLDSTNIFHPKYARIVSNMLYIKYHDYFPHERHADAVSILYMLDLYKKMYPKNEKEIKDFSYYLYYKLYKEYEFSNGVNTQKYNGSLEAFYTILKRQDIFQKFDFTDFTSCEKFLYGAPLSFDEVKEVRTRILSMKI